MKKPALLITVLAALTVLLPAQAPSATLTGTWEGAIMIMGQELKIIVHLEESAAALKGTIDIPQQMAVGLPLSNLKREADKVHFELAAGPGLAVFDGTLDQGNIRGDFLQAGMKGSFALLKTGEMAAIAPQAPEVIEVLPYKAEEVAIANGEIKLAGTLFIPAGTGPFPAVIMITGSGTQNRDEDVFGFKIFRIIADHLTRRGIAVLRCDDRGLAAPAEAMSATSRDFAADVVAQAKYLSTRDEIARDKIGLFGHSEGGIIAPMAGQSQPFAFMVLMAGTAVDGKNVLNEQIAQIARADGASDAEIAKSIAEQNRVYALMKKPEGEKEIAKMLADQVRLELEKMPADKRQAIGDSEAYVKEVTAAQLLVFRSPWFRYFLDYDPAPALEALKCPVLALFGAKDTQVSPQQNLPVMEKALHKGGNRDATLKIIPDANHLFQKAKTGSPSEYVTLEKAFVPGFLDTISSWILEKTGQANQVGKPVK